MLKTTDSYDIRRYLAILLSAGGSIAMTLILVWVIPALSAGHLFWIACGLLILIGIQQTGILALLVKREIKVTKDGVVINDSVTSGHSDG